MFCFGNEAAVLCSVSKTCGPGSCGCSPPLRIIPAQKFLRIRMHFTAENHPCAEISLNQDAFRLQNASLFEKIRCQGLFSRGECIPIQKNSLPGIIFPKRKHPYSEEFVARDHFPETNASLFGKFRCQGLFSRGESIPIRKISLSGIISPRRMHPYSEKFAARDYCSMENASLTSYFVESGCIPSSKCIPDRVFHQIRMHSSGK